MEPHVTENSPTLSDSQRAAVTETLQRYWGYDELRPLQSEAIAATLASRDSLVVLPTGGGKSLCYQIPPAILGRTDVVVSPLISLMKDQVDSLLACGYPAAAIHSGMTPQERRVAESGIAAGEYRLIFVAPERLVHRGFLTLLQGQSVCSFAIDEAHCISHWGHNFRPEYRQLTVLRKRFPDASVHAYTATATERVRHDIIEQLGLREPAVLVGCFDRPNLTYRLVPRNRIRHDVVEVLERHRGEAAIIYCISRADTDRLSTYLQSEGYRAESYHAGMEGSERRRVQEAFSDETIDIVVATVAFGMGIDRSDVRCVIHAAMPKSIEHYQQETGRAGRDGLEAECALFFSPADTLRWQKLLERSAAESVNGLVAEESLAASVGLLDHMRKFCAPGVCRHQTLSEYFGQSYENEDCGACDVCLGECDALEDGTVNAQKILSCVYRLKREFGVSHVVDVLHGAENERVAQLDHDRLSTYGLMKDLTKKSIRNMVYQLVDQRLVGRTNDTYPTLHLNERSAEILRGERQVWFVPQRTKTSVSRSKQDGDLWEGVDVDLFERLRALRLRLARERGVPSFVIFGDGSLRDMARRRPRTAEELLDVHGVGEKKLADFGEIFLAEIAGERVEAGEP